MTESLGSTSSIRGWALGRLSMDSAPNISPRFGNVAALVYYFYREARRYGHENPR